MGNRTAGEWLARLDAAVAAHESLIVGFSGGVDSALLTARAATVLGSRALAVTAVSPSLPAAERAAARRLAVTLGVRHVELATDEGEREGYIANGGDRCFHCKSALLDAAAPLAAALGATIALGTTVDDLGDHRPGQAAARERGAVAPLVEAGLGKAEVRAVAREIGLAVADKPAAACLASRVAYGEPVTPAVLAQVERAEAALHALGLPVCRVRSHSGGTMGRVELPAADLERAWQQRVAVAAAVTGAGFRFAAVDPQPFASGRMNVLLPVPSTRAGAGVTGRAEDRA